MGSEKRCRRLHSMNSLAFDIWAAGVGPEIYLLLLRWHAAGAGAEIYLLSLRWHAGGVWKTMLRLYHTSSLAFEEQELRPTCFQEQELRSTCFSVGGAQQEQELRSTCFYFGGTCIEVPGTPGQHVVCRMQCSM